MNRPTRKETDHALAAVNSGWSSRQDFINLAAEVEALRLENEQLIERVEKLETELRSRT